MPLLVSSPAQNSAYSSKFLNDFFEASTLAPLPVVLSAWMAPSSALQFAELPVTYQLSIPASPSISVIHPAEGRWCPQPKTASATNSSAAAPAKSRFMSGTPEYGEAFGRVEGPGFYPIQYVSLVVQFGHGAGEAGPIEHFVLSGRLHLRKWRIAPRIVIAGAQVLQQDAVRLQVGIDPMVLFGQERVRPARRCHDHHPPRALLENTGCRSSHLETAARRRSGRIGLVRVDSAAALVADDRTPVAVDRH